MENNFSVRKISVCVLFLFSMLLLSEGQAYYPNTTHKGLTKEIISFFNHSYPDIKIEDEEYIDAIKKGSIEEDTPALRSAHHFYDPIHNKGVLKFSSSKNWAQNTKAQAGIANIFAGTLASYFGASTDYSWERGIYDYAWGNKKRGLESLGHVLHLLEDASVPDHTRDDMHAGHNLPFNATGVSPYEDWTNKYFHEGTIRAARELRKSNNKPVACRSLSFCFDSMAFYSNENFFSPDSILNGFSLPTLKNIKIEKVKGKSRRYAYNSHNYDNYKLVRLDPKQDDPQNYTPTFDEDSLVLTDYWNLLSRQAVLHGAGVVKLFFDEVEKEKKTKALYTKNKSWITKSYDAVAQTAFGAVGVFYGTSVTQEDLDDNGQQPSAIHAITLSPAPSVLPRATPSPTDAPVSLSTPILPIPSPDPRPSPHATIKASSAPLLNPSLLVSPRFEAPGGGEPAAIKRSSPSSSPPAVPSPTVSSSAADSSSPAPSPSESASPSPTPTATSTATTTASVADTEPPSLSFAITECGQSLSPDGCLIATTTITLVWSSPDSDLAHYAIQCTARGVLCGIFSFASTTATSTIYIVPADKTEYTFTAKAIDTSDNESSSQTISVDVWLHPVVINEIAWAGTGGSPKTNKDEWVELYNPTSKTISLAGILLNSPTNHLFHIALTGSLAPRNYYLIERTDDNSISDIAANLIAPFGSGLSNDGEELALMIGPTTIDTTPAVGSNGCVKWCAGSASGLYYTMERYDPLASGEDKTNWGSWQDIVRQGTNAEFQPIHGTPKSRNSINYLISLSGLVDTDHALTKKESPYIVPSLVNIAPLATLTIEPGVVLKFKNPHSGIYASGILMAQGTASDPIVFTSFADDLYAGDTNQDGTSTSPVVGDWGLMRLLADGSIIDHAIIRYGGGDDHQAAAVKVINASASITNSIIEYSKHYGIWFDTASGSIVSTVMRKNTESGVMLADSAVTIRANTFESNNRGLFLLSGADKRIDVQSNIFINNTNEAVIVNNHIFGVFAGNTASGNGMNGILMSGSSIVDYTLQPDIPYVIGNFLIPKGRTVTIMPGVVMKFQRGALFDVAGTLKVQGSTDKPVVFTSLYDDDCGIAGGCGDTDHASTTPQAGDWFAMRFFSGSVSTLDHATVRFGGKSRVLRDQPGALQISSGASVTISHSMVEKNYFTGAWIDHASPQISDSFIRNHNGSPATGQFSGLFLTASSTPAITNTRFTHNDVNIVNSDGESAYIDGGGNVFE